MMASRTAAQSHKARRRRVLTRDGFVCQIGGPDCEGTAEFCDHIIPLAEGGEDVDDNCQAACRSCHARKSLEEATAGRLRRLERRWSPAEDHPGLR